MNMVSRNGLDMSKVQDIAGTFLRRGWSPNAKHAFGAAAAIVLDQGSENSAMDLARYTAGHFGAFRAELRDPKENTVFNSPTGAAGASSIGNDVRRHLSSNAQEPEEMDSRVDRGLARFGQPGSASLRAQGEAAVERFFEGGRINDDRLVQEGLADLDRVAAVEQGNAVDSTWQDTRSLLRYLNEQKVLHHMQGALAPVAENVGHSLSTAAARVHSRYEEVLAKTHNKALASLSSLAAGASGLVEGWDNFEAAKYTESLEYAKASGLPEAATRFYAAERQLQYKSVVDMVRAETGTDDQLNRLEAAAEREVGDKGVEALKRAAFAPDAQRDRYVQDAVAFHRRDQARAGNQPVTASPP
jgi:hypothetical protein